MGFGRGMICWAALSAGARLPPEAPLVPLPAAASTIITGVRRTEFSFDQVDASHRDLSSAFTQDWPSLVSERGLKVHLMLDRSMGAEDYRLRLGHKAEIRAGSRTGLAWGLSTLAQLGLKRVKSAEINDHPAVEFRCLMLDVARRYHSPSTLRQMIRWCSAAKVGLLQLHLTDHQNWMLPTQHLPGVDGRNSHGHPAYTREEIKNLVSYAAARGVALVPEIDVPGHSSLLIQHDPDLFKIKGSPSRDCINFASPKVRSVLKQVIREACDLFATSPYIHIGGDEASHPNAEGDPDMAAAIKRIGPNADVDSVFADFLADLSEAVLAEKKRPIIWEGFRPSAYAAKRIPKKALIVAWEGAYYPAQQLISDGYSIINAGWDPLYVVNHYPWDAYTLAPLPTLYRFSKDRFGVVNWTDEGQRGVDLKPRAAVKGAMLCWWEGHEWNAHRVLPMRIIAFGSRLWNPSAEVNYQSFSARASSLHASLSTSMAPFNHSCSGEWRGRLGSFSGPAEMLAAPTAPGLIIRAERSRAPNQESPSLPLKVAESGVYLLQAFRGKKPVGETVFVPLHKGQFISNLALDAQASSSTPEDPDFPTSSVTDGFADHVGSFWLAYPLPATLTIRLKSPQQASRVDVVPFWAAGQGCQYRVDVSQDGRFWSEVTDRAALALPVTREGASHRFPKRLVQQVRVTVKASAQYPPSMARIHEVRLLLEEDKGGSPVSLAART